MVFDKDEVGWFEIVMYYSVCMDCLYVFEYFFLVILYEGDVEVLGGFILLVFEERVKVNLVNFYELLYVLVDLFF